MWIGVELSDIEFLIDENVLGLARYLKTFDLKHRSVGDPDCPKKGSADDEVAKFAKKENLVVLTNDDNLKKQCELFQVECVFNDLTDFARKIKERADSN